MSDRNTQGQGLRDIIDSYNRELMRIHSRSRTAPDSPAAQPAAQNVSSGKKPGGTEPPVSAQARPQSSFTLENGTKAADDPVSVPAAAPPVTEDAESPGTNGGGWDQWLKELEDGLEELRKGMIELAKGQKELSDGIREWKEGVSGTKYTGEGWSVPYNGRSGGTQDDVYIPAAQDDDSAVSAANSPAPGGNPHEPAHNLPRPDEPPQNPPPADIPAQPLGYGTLCVAVNAARQAVPVKGASVTVTLPVGDRELLYSFTTTDDSGRSPEIELPVYSPESPENTPLMDEYTEYIPRFRTYRVRVQAAGFSMRDDLMAEIFDGINSTLTAELEPLPGGNNNNSSYNNSSYNNNSYNGNNNISGSGGGEGM